MSFEVHVDCLICKKLTETTISEKGTKAEALNLLHNKLCLALKLDLSPKFREWDFSEEPFPYCESCIQRVQRLVELIEQLENIKEEINGALASVSALVITSDKSDNNCVDTLIASKLFQGNEDSYESQGLQVKHNYFRSLIIQRFDPRVEVERCNDNDNCNYPGLLHEYKDYELLPKTNTIKIEPDLEELHDTTEEKYNDYEVLPKKTFLKIEPDLEGFLDTTYGTALLNEIKYEVGTSSNVKGGGELETLMGLNETWTSLSEVPDLTLVLNASDKEETSTKISHSIHEQVCYDDSSKTNQFKGFKFKVVGNGVYECCTCGHVCQPDSMLSQRNIKQHVTRVHARDPKKITPHVCRECGKGFTTSQALYQHRLYSHGAPRFQCEYCGAKFRKKFHLQRHLLKYGEHVEQPRLSLNASDAGGKLINNIPVSNAHVIQKTPLQQKDLLYDETSQTYEFQGFKFKVLEKGYECCTCGLVSAVLKRKQYDKWNMKRHIQIKHRDIPRRP